ncbi:unnamed protein product [Closterium sp. Naga37s-1]|nr:unnamed protein product [Closterium sp. Naga37s-1]
MSAQSHSGMSIGLAVDGEWAEPLTSSPADVQAAERRMQFQLACYFPLIRLHTSFSQPCHTHTLPSYLALSSPPFSTPRVLDPLFSGDYPAVMKQRVGGRLPCFTWEQQQQLKGSLDFVGVNHYTSKFGRESEESGSAAAAVSGEDEGDHFKDQGVEILGERDPFFVPTEESSLSFSFFLLMCLFYIPPLVPLLSLDSPSVPLLSLYSPFSVPLLSPSPSSHFLPCVQHHEMASPLESG